MNLFIWSFSRYLHSDVTHTRGGSRFISCRMATCMESPLIHLIDVDREVVLIVADALSFAYTVAWSTSWQLSSIVSCMRRALSCCSVVDGLVHDEGKSHERIGTCSAES